MLGQLFVRVCVYYLTDGDETFAASRRQTLAGERESRRADLEARARARSNGNGLRRKGKGESSPQLSGSALFLARLSSARFEWSEGGSLLLLLLLLLSPLLWLLLEHDTTRGAVIVIAVVVEPLVVIVGALLSHARASNFGGRGANLVTTCGPVGLPAAGHELGWLVASRPRQGTHRIDTHARPAIARRSQRPR